MILCSWKKFVLGTFGEISFGYAYTVLNKQWKVEKFSLLPLLLATRHQIRV